MVAVIVKAHGAQVDAIGVFEKPEPAIIVFAGGLFVGHIADFFKEVCPGDHAGGYAAIVQVKKVPSPDSWESVGEVLRVVVAVDFLQSRVVDPRIVFWIRLVWRIGAVSI